MILRKPYAFLIKNFKIIHLVLTVLMIYIIYRLNGISKFIYNYIDNVANSSNNINFNNRYFFSIIYINAI